MNSLKRLYFHYLGVVDGDGKEPVPPPDALAAEHGAVVEEAEESDDDECDEPEPVEDEYFFCYSVCSQETQVVCVHYRIAKPYLPPLTHGHPGEHIREDHGPAAQGSQPPVTQGAEISTEEFFHDKIIQKKIDDIQELAKHEGYSVFEMTPGIVVLHNELGHVVYHNVLLLQVFRTVHYITTDWKLINL